MDKSGNGRHAIGRAAIGFGFVGLLACCTAGPPAPVYLGGGEASGWGAGPPPRPMPPAVRRDRPLAARPLPPRERARRVLVERGQSLGSIARRYHVSRRALIAANRLHPPYKIEAGAYLLIPGAASVPIREAALPEPPPRIGPPPTAALPPPAAAARQPDVIPLDGPAPPSAGAVSTPLGAAPPPPPGEPSVAAEARADSTPPAAPPPAARDSRFPWPVRGRVLAGFGASANGTRNDGINIAAPRGAPVRAIAGGEIAYAGNQVPGYGNLILVKHPGGWISAYAHCENLLVAKGEAVRAGQVIARVGTTGGVTRPQLHFELRRGEHPVDPRDYLTPLPSAASRAGSKAG